MVDIGNDTEFAGFVSGKFDGGFDFGEHGAGFEMAVFDEFFQFRGGDFGEGGLVGCVEIKIDIWHGSDGNKNVGADELGEFFGGVIFVDHGVDAFEAFQNFSTDDRNATTASSDNDDAVFDQFNNGFFLDNVDRFG